ncbi:hypothetical protein GM418_17415 [Maribellus comscasis]|uniref:DUF1794 domain-containing protein n=1 Tax=Maribellus comscasis TaxID=2681766 RepID=A0A6I6JYW0_9BACT|nr:hypothetical protein [Maribellus comscasis]QGY45387.1 hypothetical protein GM418_17415 [Maribellus comscasis]
MKKYLLLFVVLTVFTFDGFTQENPLQKFSFLIGNWEGTGSGFSASKSVIHSEFKWVLNNNFIEVKNHSEFEPTSNGSNGEIHDDRGMISFDKERNVYVFRQFHNEGYYNRYILNDSLSTKESFVFETEFIENFVPGGRARFTINVKNDFEIETVFDVGFPGKEMACFGTNQLKRKEDQ